MSRLSLMVVAATMFLNVGCAVEAEDVDGHLDAFDDQAAQEGADDVQRSPSDEADVAFARAGDFGHGAEFEDVYGEASLAADGERQGPDPTPWKLAEPGDDVSGPDPTPWHDDDSEAGDGNSDGSKTDDGDGRGPDPTPWKRLGDGSDRLMNHDSEEPDPQPWHLGFASAVGSRDD